MHMLLNGCVLFSLNLLYLNFIEAFSKLVDDLHCVSDDKNEWLRSRGD